MDLKRSAKEQPTESELLAEITRRIRSASDPQQIVLFGSHARGEHGRDEYGRDSDLDLLVIVDQTKSTWEETTRIYKVLADLTVPIDVVVVRRAYVERYGDLVGTVVRPALHEGNVLYAQ